jgi:hypothetical protein
MMNMCSKFLSLSDKSTKYQILSDFDLVYSRGKFCLYPYGLSREAW